MSLKGGRSPSTFAAPEGGRERRLVAKARAAAKASKADHQSTHANLCSGDARAQRRARSRRKVATSAHHLPQVSMPSTTSCVAQDKRALSPSARGAAVHLPSRPAWAAKEQQGVDPSAAELLDSQSNPFAAGIAVAKPTSPELALALSHFRALLWRCCLCRALSLQTSPGLVGGSPRCHAPRSGVLRARTGGRCRQKGSWIATTRPIKTAATAGSEDELVRGGGRHHKEESRTKRRTSAVSVWPRCRGTVSGILP